VKRSFALALALIVASGVVLGAFAVQGLSAERLRIADALRRAHAEGLRPVLNQAGRLFADAQSGFLAAVRPDGSGQQEATPGGSGSAHADTPDPTPLILAAADQAVANPGARALTRAAGEPFVRYAFELVNGELRTYSPRKAQGIPLGAQRFLTGQQKLPVGKQLQQELAQFAEQQERHTAQQNGQPRQTVVQPPGQSAGVLGNANDPEIDPPQQDEQQRQPASQQADAQQLMAPVRAARDDNWALEPSSFAELVADADAQYLPILLGTKLEILYWQRTRAEGKGGSPSGFGFALDTDALRAELARAVALHPRSDDVVVAVHDDQGALVATNSGGPLVPGDPLVALELHARLPHWRLTAHWSRPDALDELARAKTWSLGVLLGGCALALVLGLLLLARELRRETALAAKQADFVSNVSHELKTPLTSIRMYAELLERRFPDVPRAVEYAGVIKDESDRLARLVGQILDFARARRGKRPYHKAPVDLGGVLDALVREHRARAEPLGVAITFDRPAEPIEIHADAEAIAQAIGNLVSNALKYGDGTPIAVALEPDADGGARILVRDQGPGVPRRWRTRIFDEFVRVDNALSARTAGSGLGLTIARQVVVDHGGEIAVIDPPDGPGALFIVRLPREGPSGGAGRV